MTKNQIFSSPLNLAVVSIHPAVKGPVCALPLFNTSVAAGIPSQADDHIERELDLNDFMVKNPCATFFVRVEGESMRDAGILSGDMLVVDRSLTPSHDKIIVAILDGEFTVKRLIIEEEKVYLEPANPNFHRMEVHPDSFFQVWGVVTYVIHKP